MVISLWVLPIASFRPNRVMKGIPLFMADLLGGGIEAGFKYSSFFSIMAFLGFIAAYMALGARKSRIARAASQAMGWILAFAPALLLVLISGYKPDATASDEAVLRISPGAGFWFFIVSVFLLQRTFRNFNWQGFASAALMVAVVAFGWSPRLSLFKEYLNVRNVFIAELWRHLELAFSSVAISIFPGVFLGYFCHRSKKARELILGFVNLFQVIPTLSLLALIMIPLAILADTWPFLGELGIRGIGFTPAFIVLCLYCLLPITTNAFAGFDKVDREITDSAVALGMTERQVLWRVSVPLALPVIVSGIRTAVTQNIGNAILAGLIGGGGMGTLIFLGLSQSASDLVILGTIPVVLLALAAEGFFELMARGAQTKTGGFRDTLAPSR